MSTAVVGGMKRLEAHYRKEADSLGIKLKVFNDQKVDLRRKLSSFDAGVLFTNRAKIPLLQIHSCGVCSLRECLQQHLPQ